MHPACYHEAQYGKAISGNIWEQGLETALFQQDYCQYGKWVHQELHILLYVAHPVTTAAHAVLIQQPSQWYTVYWSVAFTCCGVSILTTCLPHICITILYFHAEFSITVPLQISAKPTTRLIAKRQLLPITAAKPCYQQAKQCKEMHSCLHSNTSSKLLVHSCLPDVTIRCGGTSWKPPLSTCLGASQCHHFTGMTRLRKFRLHVGQSDDYQANQLPFLLEIFYQGSFQFWIQCKLRTLTQVWQLFSIPTFSCNYFRAFFMAV